jgi:hypothetical protein
MDRDFLNWLVGLVEGEGSFIIRRRKNTSYYSLRFVITLRADDTPVLLSIKNSLGFGSILHRSLHSQNLNHGDIARFYVSHNRDLVKLVRLFDTCEFRTKKKRDYDIWKTCVGIKQLRSNALHPYLAYAYNEIRKIRQYSEPSETIISPTILVEKTCVICGKIFMPSKYVPNAITCGSRCNDVRQHNLVKERKFAKRIKVKVCLKCGKEFEPHKKGWHKVMWCKECKTSFSYKQLADGIVHSDTKVSG